MSFDRTDLRAAYSILPLAERQKLADHMGFTMPQQRRYCLAPRSDKIGQKRMAKFLSFYPEEKWLTLAEEARAKTLEPIELKIQWPEVVELPDIVNINGRIYYAK